MLRWLRKQSGEMVLQDTNWVVGGPAITGWRDVPIVDEKPECIHNWDTTIVLTSLPPQYRCKKCGEFTLCSNLEIQQKKPEHICSFEPKLWCAGCGAFKKFNSESDQKAFDKELCQPRKAREWWLGTSEAMYNDTYAVVRQYERPSNESYTWVKVREVLEGDE